MGYECPVCATPQADARHLANHMAFTAVLGETDHEAWLDEHAPGWSEAGEAELAPRVAEHAPEHEFPQVFEDTAGGLEEAEDPTDPLEERSGALFEDSAQTHTHTPGHDPSHAHGHGITQDPDPEDLDEETREVLEEARELTREMLADEAAGDPDEDEVEEDDPDEDEVEEGSTDEGRTAATRGDAGTRDG